MNFFTQYRHNFEKIQTKMVTYVEQTNNQTNEIKKCSFPTLI